MWAKKFLDSEVYTRKGRPRFTSWSMSMREIKIEVITEVMIPIIIVVANPWIGPLPKMNRIRLVRNVVDCESMIEGKACL